MKTILTLLLHSHARGPVFAVSVLISQLADPMPIVSMANVGDHAYVKPTGVVVTAPMYVRVGEPARITVSLLDSRGYLSNAPARIRLQTGDQFAVLPQQVIINEQDSGSASIVIVFNTVGNHFVFAAVQLLDSSAFFYRSSSPVICDTVFPRYRIFWGDLHTHTGYSDDGVGSLSEMFANLRRSGIYDFVISSEHHNSRVPWNDVEHLVRSNLTAGFLPILGVEVTTSQGHAVLYGPPSSYQILKGLGVIGSLGDAWNYVERADVIGHIAHPDTKNNTFDIRMVEPRILRNIEIANMVVGGISEYFNNSPSYVANQVSGFSVQDALETEELGFIGVSDTHVGVPIIGPRTAVLAESLSIESILQALKNRRTYVSTGRKVFLDVRINDSLQVGDVALVSRGSGYLSVRIKLEIVSPEIVNNITIVKNGSDLFSVFPAVRSVNFIQEDSVNVDVSARNYYYARIELADGTKIWSSPIWINQPKKEMQKKAQVVHPTIYPNPTNGDANVGLLLTNWARTVISVHDLLGRELARYDRGELPPGEVVISFPMPYPTGSYFVRSQIGHQSFVSKFLVVR